MANDAGPTRKTKDDENNNSKGRHTSGKGSPGMITSPSRKSERIEKRNSTTPVKKKPARVEKQTVPIPLRRSERSKKPNSSNSSESKKSDKSLSSPDMERKKEKKEKSMKQLTMETKKVEGSNKREKRIKRLMSGRAYLAFIKDKVKTTGRNEERSSASVSISTKEMLEGNVESLKHGSGIEANGPEVLDASDGGEIAIEICDNAERPQLKCFAKEKLQSPELLNCTMKGKPPNDYTGVEMDCEAMSLKRKRTDLNTDSDSSAVVANKDTCIASEDVTSSPLSCENENCVKTCGSCFKRQRFDHDSKKQESCCCRQNLKENLDKEDRGELEAVTTEVAAEFKNHMQQNESFESFPANGSTSICIVCKLGGHLLCCDGKGCKRSCHLSCLDPPLEDAPPGAWHCIQCIRKKIESGVHSLSEGVESIWDSREVEVSDDSGSRRQKQYFVKYKGFAHVHNCWVPEHQLLCEVPSLVAKFNRKNQSARWKQEWTVPHRLLQRRSLVSPKQCDESFGDCAIDNIDCNYEWLVKWRSLGYEHATWELENAPFINSTEGRSLIRDYEDCHKRVKIASCSSSLFTIEKANKSKRGFTVKLSAGSSSGFDNKLDFVNKLREYWRKGQNAVVFDDQERIAKVISLIFSLLSDCSRPFLIISTTATLHLWDDEFLRLAPSAHVVLYSGNREVRKNIRTIEFYDGGGCIMFQVLITSPEVLVEDLNVFESIGWEAVVVDECHRSKIFSHFEQIKVLTTDMRLLLVGGQLKDTIAEYLNLLSLLDSPSSDELIIDPNDTIGGLKEKLLKYIAYEGKSDTSRFVEYWIPVQISSMQLEQYCATLLLNNSSLCSPMKSDTVGVLRDILISVRKCCDHPYLVNESLQSLLIKDKESEFLDVGIKASGKLQLLDTMLSEMKNRGLRVLILFQVNSGSKMGLGDILDDFIRLRFGPDSYERIDGNIRSKEKQVALNNFNKESGRFVFLLETRACLPSITLSSIDTVIIFNSDWSPVNDIRALQRISIDPQFEKIKIFRLYSPCTVEEKVLILAKQDKTPDGYLQNSRPSTSHLLLMWGALYLFNRLDEFHGGNTPASSASNFFDQSFWKDVIQEFITIITQTGEDNDTCKFNIILEVKQNLGTYSSDFQLFGESEIEVMDEGLAHIFWKNLLEGKSPCWKYCSGSSQRSRKRAQPVDDLQKKPDAEHDEVVKKHRKLSNNSDHPSSLKPGVEGKVASGDKKGTSGIPAHCETTFLNRDSTKPSLVNNILEVPKEVFDSQESLYLLLKPEMAKLCEVLKLKDDAKDMVEKFLEYVMNNHRVSREQPTIVQAFQISLCWTAASLLKQKIDHKESLALAKQYLNFGCNKEEADLVYSKLRCLKDIFLQKVKVEIEEWSPDKECSDNHDHLELARKDISKSIKNIKKNCSKKMAKVHQKHQEEKEGIDRKYEEEKARLENNKRTEVAIIRLQSHSNTSMQTDRLKKLDNEYAKQFQELQCERDRQLKSLEAMLEVKVNKVRDKEASWMKEFNSWLLNEFLHRPSFHKSGDGVQCLQTSEQVNVHDNHESVAPASSHLSERSSPDIMLVREAGGMESTVVNETWNGGAEACGLENVVLVNTPSSEEQAPDRVESLPDGAVLLEVHETCSSCDGPETVIAVDFPASGEQIPNQTILTLPDEEVLLRVPENFGSGDNMENDSINLLSSRDQYPDGTTCIPDAEALLRNQQDGCSEPTTLTVPDGDILLQVPENVSSGDNLENDSVDPFSSRDQVPDSTTCMPDAEALSGNLRDGHAASSEMQIDTRQIEPPLLHSFDAVASDQSNHGAQATEPLAQLQLSTYIDSPSGQNPSGLPSVSVVEHQPSIQIAQAPTVMVENHVELSDLAVSQPVASFVPNPLVDIPIDGLGTNTFDPRTASVPPGYSNHTVQNAHPGAPQFSLPLYRDPLQKELERLRKETEDNIKTHEETKLRLKSDCDQEIEEVVTQIRRKYEMKLKETEAEFLTKKRELDTNQNKVLMNKILADAFRCKCTDQKQATAALQQEVYSSFIQQRARLSSQHQAQRPSSALAGPSSSGPPTVIPQTAVAPAVSPQTSLPAVSPRTGARPVQAVQHTSALFLTTPSRPPPQISSITSAGNHQVGSRLSAPPHLTSAGNHQVGSGLSAPPHLRPFRPSGMIPSQPIPNNPPATSPSPSLLRQHPAYHQPLTHNRAHPVNTSSGGVSSLHKSSLSALELLMEISNRSEVSPILPSSFPSQSSFGSSAQPESGLRNSSSQANPVQNSSGQANPIQNSSAADVVCLSDDEND